MIKANFSTMTPIAIVINQKTEIIKNYREVYMPIGNEWIRENVLEKIDNCKVIKMTIIEKFDLKVFTMDLMNEKSLD